MDMDAMLRELLKQAQRTMNSYRVTVHTGDVQHAGTDANVFITLFGEAGDSGERKVEHGRFKRGGQDEMKMECRKLGRLRKVRVRHDNRGLGSGWFLDKVVVEDLDNGFMYEFPCGRWLALDEDDRAISRDLISTVAPLRCEKEYSYRVTVITGSKANAGTDAKVYIMLSGGITDSAEKRLHNPSGACFQKGRKDEFDITCPWLGHLEKIRIRHDNTGHAPGWYLEKVIILDTKQQQEYEFPCQKWLALDEVDRAISRELKCSTQHAGLTHPILETCKRLESDANREIPCNKAYPVDTRYPGMVFIVNIETFTCPFHKKRSGSNKDVQNLVKTFSKYGFLVHKAENLEKLALMKQFISWADDPMLEMASSCIVVVMSHGEEGNIISADGATIPITENIISLFNGKCCPMLAGKPKMFVIHACRGKVTDTGVGVEEHDGPCLSDASSEESELVADAAAMQRIPLEADMVLAYSTSPGYKCWRDPTNGSWYINALCDVFSNYGNTTHVTDMLVSVNDNVASRSGNKGEKQMPMPIVGLRKHWFLRGRIM